MINNYHIIEKIGQGSFGEVLKVSNDDGNIFALKIIDKGDLESPDNPKAVMAKNEINSMLRLHNPHIIHLHEVINDPEATNQYLVMEFLPKKSI
jgi:cyclin-dependent kinase